MKCQEARENYIMRSSTICTLFQIVFSLVKEDEVVGHIARMEEIRNAYKILVGKSEGKKALGISER
jgi:hypothetical protein